MPVGESFASMEDRGVPEPSDAEEKRARLFGFVEAGATEEDLPAFAAALNEYVDAALSADVHRLKAELAQARTTALRGAANDIRRLAANYTTDRAEEAS